MSKLAIIAFGAVMAAACAAGAAEPIPAFILGQNVEHTRSAVQGGLSAQLVRNRKFAGRPQRNGIAMMWEPCGAHAFYNLIRDWGFTHHATRSSMNRRNELSSQVIGCLDAAGESGIMQGEIGIRGGVSHTFRAVVSTLHEEDTPVVLRVSSGGRVLAERAFTVRTKGIRDWKRVSFDFTLERDTMADIAVLVKGKRYIVVGAVSVMPGDNFYGMRADVVEHLREIGTSIVRWPGGNFAGEYRWRDGLIADPDERAPLQSYHEMKTHPHTLGYDSNDIGMEDVLALCEKIGAKPFFTINIGWDSPADSADWVKACRGRVKLWGLGNEMGHGHMEGPNGPKGYTAAAVPHAEAMLKVDPTLEFIASGAYPQGGKNWIENSAKPIARVAPTVAYHRYENIACACIFDYTTPERTAGVYADVSRWADESIAALGRFRAALPREIGISYDEWNIWYSWFREEGIVEGLYVAKMLNMMMRNWEALGLKCVCYFQAVNEQAICVNPFESHLTAAGEAMRLWKGHVGGVPTAISDLPDNAFVTDHSDGSRYMTFYNFSVEKPCTFRIPIGGRGKIVAAETLVPNGFEIGCRYARRPGAGKINGDFYELTLPPACQAQARLSAVGSTATNIYVSPRGDDSADGSLERPFATVGRARDAVRAMKKAGAFPKGGVTVWLRGGTYRMERPLSLGTKDSGEEGAPVSYRAWKDETPVLLGGWVVPSSAWHKADDPRIPDAAKGKVWCADVKSLGYGALDSDAPCGFHTSRPLFRIRSLYRNGKHLPLARYPNSGFIKTGKLAQERKGAFTAEIGDWTRWTPERAPDLRALGYWKWLWADETLPVVVDPAAKVIAFDSRPQGQARNGSFHLSEASAANMGSGELYDFSVRNGMPFCLLNALAALDAPGEWYFDRGSGILYVRPPEDKDPRGDKYELSSAAFTLLSVEKASHLRFEGIVFRCGRHHGVELKNVSDVAVEGCVVRDFGGNGLILKGARNCVVHGNVFHTFGHCAMLLDGGDRRTLTESGVTVEANDFSDTGLAMRTYTPGIWVSGCGHRIVRNVLHDIPSSAMRVGGNEHFVASNLVERVVLESDDQGAVDMWGDPTYRGNKFIHNIWRDIGRGGEFVKCGQAGIRFDDAISGNLVYGNRFDNCSRANFGGVQIHGGRGNVVRNNVFTLCPIGVSFSPWKQEKWRDFLTNAAGKKRAKSANADGAVFRAKYPEYATAPDAPMVNVVECNVYEGDASAFTRNVPSAGKGAVKGNVCVKKLPSARGDARLPVPGFEPLPPESTIGPGDDAILKRAMSKE